MIKKWIMLSLVISFTVTPIWAQGDINLTDFSGIANATLIDTDILAGGPPTPADIRKAKAAGIKTIIDLRSVEDTTEERNLVIQEGIQYVNIPVTPQTLSFGQVDAVAKIIEQTENRPVIIHCKSGNRAASIWALYQFKHKGLAAADAYEAGLNQGLRKEEMKTATQKLLGLKNENIN